MPLCLEKYNLEARKVAQLSYNWKIGMEDRDGRQVNIWRDRWLPTLSTFRVVSPRHPQSAANYVCDLLDDNTKTC